MDKIYWHNLFVGEVVAIAKTDPSKGLTEKAVNERIGEFGKNKLAEEKPFSKLSIFFDQFKSPLIYILLIAGIIVLFFKEYTDAIVIFGAVFLNTIVGFFQENKASKALSELKKIVKHEAKVIRDGEFKNIDSSEIVFGDIFVLSPGDRVSADGRVIESHDLKINEMALTGEWVAARKTPDTMAENTPLADRDNMVYMGTIVEDGKGKILVTETGQNTELGKISLMVKETKEEKTPLQKKVLRLSKFIAVAVTIVAFLIFLEGILTQRDPLIMCGFNLGNVKDFKKKGISKKSYSS